MDPKRDEAAARAGRRSSRGAKPYLPLITLLLFAGLFGLYYSSYVTSQESYFNDRAFRLLALQGDKIANRVEAIRSIFRASSFYEQATADGYLETNLRPFGVVENTISVVQLYPSEEKQHFDGTFLLGRNELERGLRVHAEYWHPALSDPSRVAQALTCADAAAAIKSMRSTGKKCFHAAADLDLEPMAREIVEASNEEFFDDVLIAETSGKVFYQHSSQTVRISDLSLMVRLGQPDGAAHKPAAGSAGEKPAGSGGSGPANGGAPKEKGSSADSEAFAAASEFSNVVPVHVSGAAYQLYLRPLPRVLFGERGQAVPTVLCGLRLAARAKNEALALPYTYLIFGGIVLLLVFTLTWPILKISYVSPKERLQHSHVLFLILSTMVAAVLMTLFALNLSYTDAVEKGSVNRLNLLSLQMKANLKDELLRALRTLDACSTPDFLARLAEKPGWNPVPNVLAGYGNSTLPLCGQKATQDFPSYFRFLAWLDWSGTQEFKLAVDRQSTPRVDHTAQDYFRAVAGCVKGRRPSRDDVGCDVSVLQDPGRSTSYQYRAEPIFSPNTGEFLVVVSAPYQPPDGSDARLERLKTLRVKAIVLRFESLVEPVLPPGYGFAILDPQGKVQFHSVAGRNLIEDFFKESQMNAILTAAVAERAEGNLEVNYLGSLHEIHVTPLEVFQSPRWTLVFFRNTTYFTTLNLTTNLAFLILVGFYSLPFLLWAVSHMMGQQDYPLESIWPDKSKVRNYAHILLSNCFLGALFLAVYAKQSILELTISIAGLIAVGCVLPFWQRQEARGWAERVGKFLVLSLLIWFAWGSLLLLFPLTYVFLMKWGADPDIERAVLRNLELKYMYTMAVASILVVLVVAPCCGLFKMSFDTVQRLSVERQVQVLEDRFEQRWDRLRRYYQTIEAPGLLTVRRNEVLDRYDLDSLNRPGIEGTVSAVSPARSLLDRLVAAVTSFPSHDPLSAELRVVASATPANFRYGFLARKAPARQAAVGFLRVERPQSDQMDIPPISAAFPVWPGFEWTGILVLVIALDVLILWVYSVTRNVFLIDLQDARELDGWEAADGARWNLIIIGHPKSGKRGAVRDVPGVRPIDLAQLITSNEWELFGSLGDVVVLEHFEFAIGDPETNLRKLELLERLLYVERKRVFLLSTVDPLIYLTAGGRGIASRRESDSEASRRILDRWAAALSSFRKVKIKDTSIWKFARSLEMYGRRGAAANSNRLAELVKTECDHTAYLRRFGRIILLGNPKGPGLSKEELIEEMLDRADAYYWSLWATCTRDERLVLFQLAQDGWANPKNEIAIQQLQRRKLITRFSGFRIMNESFRRFIRRNEHPEEIARWKRESEQSIWGAIRLSLAIAAVLLLSWLFYAQQQDLGVAISYVGAAGAAGSALFRLVAQLKGGGSGAAAPGATSG